jgi:hypothetical protein
MTNKLPKALQTRIANVSMTIRNLIADVMVAIVDPEAASSRAGTTDARAVRGQAIDGSRPGTSPDEMVAFLERLIGSQGQYRPGADTIAYGLARATGRQMSEIADFFNVEVKYVQQRMNSLLKQTRKRKGMPDPEAEGPAGAQGDEYPEPATSILEIFAERSA